MQKIKNVITVVKENLTELYLGLLLFAGVPLIGLLYLDLRAFIALTILFQTIILFLYFRRKAN